MMNRIVIYYESRTRNVKHFLAQVAKLRPSYQMIDIKSSDHLMVAHRAHFVTYTDHLGATPLLSYEFVQMNFHKILSISVSGNRNGATYALAAQLISEEFNIPINTTFELSGLQADVLNFINFVEVISNSR